jgi:hypothetical protein
MNRRGATGGFFVDPYRIGEMLDLGSAIMKRSLVLFTSILLGFSLSLFTPRVFSHAGTLASAEETSLVIYNTDLGLVKQTISLDLVRGVQSVTFTNIPARIDPTSVRLEAREGGFRLREQDYRPDQMNAQNVLAGYENRNISVWLHGGSLVQGTLLSAAGDIILSDSAGKVNILRAESIERYEFPELPPGLVNTPTLVWKLASDRAGKTDALVSYLTGGLTWHAEYGAVVNSAETEMELSSFISIENSSGRTYENASLKLVAGDIHRAQSPRPGPVFRLEKSTMAAADRAQDVEERAVSEYHLYELKSLTTLPDASVKQVAFNDPVIVKVQRRFVYDPVKNPTDVMVNVEFVNSEKEGPNTALPAGKVRIYHRDADNDLVLVGEDTLDHTPKNEKVRLTLGNAFDLKAERKVADVRSISPRVNEQRIGISLRNRKTDPVSITAVEHLYGDWEIIQKTHEWVKKDAVTAEFTVTVPANGETVIEYTARFRY